MSDDFVTDFGRELRAAAHRRARPGRRTPAWGRLVAVAAALAAVVFALIHLPGPGEREAALPKPGVAGREAPVAVLPPLFHTSRPTPGFLSHPTLVTFGASWCEPCVRDVPVLEAARPVAARASVSMFYVATQDTRRSFRDLDVPAGLRPAFAIDRDGSYARRWRIRSYPTSALVDSHGRIVAQRAGPLDTGWLRENLARLTEQGRSEMAATISAFAALRDRGNLVAPPEQLRAQTENALGGTRDAETHLVYARGGYRMWVMLTPNGSCTLTQLRRGGGGGGCGPYTDALAAGANGPGFTYAGKGTIQLEGIVPDGTHGARVHLGGGRTRSVPIRGNVVFARVPETARRVTWIAPDGTRQSFPLGAPKR